MPRSARSHHRQKNWSRAVDKRRRQQHRNKRRRQKLHHQLEQTGDLSLSGRAVVRNESLHATEEERRSAAAWRKWEQEQWEAYCDAVDECYQAQEEEEMRERALEDERREREQNELEKRRALADPHVAVWDDRNPYDGHGDRGAPCGDPTRPTSSLDCTTMQWTFYDYDDDGSRFVTRVEDTKHTPQEYRKKKCCPACGFEF